MVCHGGSGSGSCSCSEPLLHSGRFRGPHPSHLLTNLTALGIELEVALARSARPDLFLPRLPGSRGRNQPSAPASIGPVASKLLMTGTQLARRIDLCASLRAGHSGPTSSLLCTPMRRLLRPGSTRNTPDGTRRSMMGMMGIG